MSKLLTRAPRALMFAVAAIFTMSLLAPLAAYAGTDLAVGDHAVISNPNGSGANLRSDVSSLDDANVILELAQDTQVTILEGPVVVDTGVWFWVLVAEPVEGWVEASMLRKVDTPQTDLLSEAPEAPAEQEAVSGLPWAEPIDSAVVVDDNAELPVDGLAVRVSATVDGEIIGRAPVGTLLDVTEPRTWVGEQSFVRVNFNGQGGYVNGTYVVLDSEVVAEPVVEEPVVEEPVVPEEPVIEEPVIEEPVVEDVTVIEEPVVEDVVTDAPVVEDEPVVDEAQVEDVPVVEEPAVEAPVTEEVPVDTDVPADEPVVDEAPADVPVEDAPVVEEPVADEVDTGDTPVVEDEAPADVPAEDDAIEDPAVEEPIVEEATPEFDEDATNEAAEDVVEDEATEAVEDVALAVSSTPAFDPATMIGSATVTGTIDGLRCRVAPEADAATLMVLSEGTKVMVFTEAVNGYLGIDCGGVQGYADVNYLWSGGAVDAEIPAANVSLVVSGTGNGLNCRSGAGTSFPVITVLMDGATLTTSGKATNGWVGVTCGGQQGFVSVTWVDVTSSTAPGGSGSGSGSQASGTATVVNTGGDGLYCRSGAGSSYSIITVLSPGQSVSVRGANQGAWTPVTCGGANGFAHSQYLSISGGGSAPAPAPSNPAPTQPSTPTGSVTVANTGGVGLNCRSGAGTGFPVITVLSLGQTVSTRSGSTSGWVAVTCGGQNGFIASEYTTSGGTAPAPSNPAPSQPAPAPQPSGMVNGDHAKSTANVNLRYSASLGAGVATVVPTGTVVQITGGASSGFYPVNWDGLSGYMSADYLVKTSEALSKRGGSASPTTPTNPAPAPGGSATGSAMVNYAMNYLGYPYVWATAGPSSFDCSGFTYWVVKNVMGLDIGRGTWTQVAVGTPISRNNVQPGDLIFHQNTYTAGLSHVGMYIGDGKMINALNENAGVVISDITSDYWESRWYGARRL